MSESEERELADAMSQKFAEWRLRQLRETMEFMRPQDRVELFHAISKGYCLRCGFVLGSDRTCHCDNDE